MMRVLSKLCLVQHDRFDALALAASPNELEAALDAAPYFSTAEKPNDHVEPRPSSASPATQVGTHRMWRAKRHFPPTDHENASRLRSMYSSTVRGEWPVNCCTVSVGVA